MAHRFVIKVQYPVKAKKGEARGKGGLLQKCIIFTGSTKEDALADAKAWQDAHNASPYGEIIETGWGAI